MRSIIWKYSKRIRGASGALGGNQLVDLLAEITQDEILIRRCFAIVDFLGPLLERKLDAERLVDGKGDVEEVEAVDFEIVDGVTFRFDIFARDITGFRNNISNFVKRSRHQAFSARSRWAPPVVGVRIAKDMAEFNAADCPSRSLPQFAAASGRRVRPS